MSKQNVIDDLRSQIARYEKNSGLLRKENKKLTERIYFLREGLELMRIISMSEDTKIALAFRDKIDTMLKW